ncbi:MAG: bifunctional hydroxymethylpyrimidine kinase/phosphomethylpyrimidine kinase [Corynebacterium sp.]|nr:bifunctional hydroxymethylpyrimidine kinase/phosphomethylpyrimidine kinase [Corynebacterium sp.]
MRWDLYLVTDPDGNPELVPDIVAQAIAGGVTVVQLRDKHATKDQIRERAQALAAVVGDVPLFLNDHLDIAAELGIHAHIGQGDMPYAEARRVLPDHLMLGLSIETIDQLEHVIETCREVGVKLPDVIGIGPVQATATKPDHAAPLGVAGVHRIARLAAAHGIRTVAIGGVDKHNAPSLQQVDGICVVSAIMSAPDPAAAARELRAAFACRRPTVPRVLSIAGTDPTGGAGVQADLKSIAAAGGYGMSAVTALVAQNTHGVRSIHTPPVEFLREQLDAVTDDVVIDAVKIGMLGTVDTISIVRQWLVGHPMPLVVLDPVMVATSGHRLIDPEAEQAIIELAQLVDVVTPNIPELAVLVEADKPAETFEQVLAQAASFARNSNTIVIAKGGHLHGPEADNAAVYPDGRVHTVRTHRVDTTNTHGTGCSLSSALATRLAAGDTSADALEWVSYWINDAIAAGAALEVGEPGGHGPVDHFHQLRRLAAGGNTQPWSYTGETGYQPLIPAVGPHTKALWESMGQVWGQIMDLPFIRRLGDGSLRKQAFDFYLNQDAQYLVQYSRALAVLAAKAPDPQHQVEWADSARECLVVEAQLHRDWLDAVDPVASHVTLGYTNFLTATAYGEDYVIGAAAVLPCYWLYTEVGAQLAAGNHPDHPYHEWLGTYGDEEFVGATVAALKRVEQAMAQATPEQQRKATEAFRTACAYEREFFDQADRDMG